MCLQYSASQGESKPENDIIAKVFRLERHVDRSKRNRPVYWLLFIDDVPPVRLTTLQLMSPSAVLKKCLIERGKWVGWRSGREHRDWVQSLLDEMLARAA